MVYIGIPEEWGSGLPFFAGMTRAVSRGNENAVNPDAD